MSYSTREWIRLSLGVSESVTSNPRDREHLVNDGNINDYDDYNDSHNHDDNDGR